MLLGFYPQIGGKPTSFKEKIHAGLKLHSMRKNKGNRWRVGMKITMVYGHRTKHMEKFHEATVKGLQIVTFVYDTGKAPAIYIGGRLIGIMEAITLATNDGFESYTDFLNFFNKTDTYTLIHWTDFKYNGDPAQWEDANKRGVEFYGWGKQSIQSAILNLDTHVVDAFAYLIHSMHPTPAFPPGGYIPESGPEVIVPTSKPGAHTMTVSPEWYKQLKNIKQAKGVPVVAHGVGGWCVDSEAQPVKEGLILHIDGTTDEAGNIVDLSGNGNDMVKVDKCPDSENQQKLYNIMVGESAKIKQRLDNGYEQLKNQITCAESGANGQLKTTSIGRIEKGGDNGDI